MAMPPEPQSVEEPSYIDYETFLSPDFAPASFANSLVLATNNPDDSPLDLSTPLSRVLFDAQEIDSHIHLLTSRSAVPLLQYTQSQTQASKAIVAQLDAQIASLNDSYKQLEREIIDKHAEAEEIRQVALRLWETLRLGRSMGRCLQLGRQLEAQFSELGGPGAGKSDHGALVRCSYTILSLREVLDSKAPGEEGHGLDKLTAIKSLRDAVTVPIERRISEVSERLVREFAIPSSTTFAQGEEARSRLASAVSALYLLSPTAGVQPERWSPRLLLQALDAYVRSALQASTAALSRSLGQLPTLDKSLAEVVSHCQNIASLELILEATETPLHPLVPAPAKQKQHSLIQSLLSRFETSSLISYFWRTMASNISARVQEIASRGGIVARTLRTNSTVVGDAIRQAVVKGGQTPNAFSGGKKKPSVVANWDREIAVMMGSVLNNIGR
ncbi:cog5-conserved oligomeric golgi complex [Trichoderma cornu-damae]|uniref:Conserved oligomeric Golgi complex subunit 5 n=1 Tax=Trichoderma cornu-damae TaxID=654480 RepID=A0A9P8TUT7_9HYPO|nr:cog5-conserved oligomeric golgi complex [Trichoderma cornu-damae]